MNIVPRSQLRQGLFALDRSHCHFGLKCRRMIAAGSLRHISPSFQAISSLGLDGVATYPVVSRSGASSNLHIGGVATDGSETIRRHMTWGARIPPIAIGDTISVHVVNVAPEAAEAP